MSREGDRGIRARWTAKGSRRSWQSNTKGVHQRQLGEGGSASEGHGPEPAGVTWIIAARVGLIKIAKVMGLGKG